MTESSSQGRMTESSSQGLAADLELPGSILQTLVCGLVKAQANLGQHRSNVEHYRSLLKVDAELLCALCVAEGIIPESKQLKVN